jgi:hypothetical protein
MTTKKLLLTAAALLAVGIVSSRADSPVYSQNVVGYATMTLPDSSGTTLYMQSCPFVIGVSNGANEVYGLNANPGNLPTGTLILLWNPSTTVQGAANTYTTFYYDPSYIGAPYFLGAWWDSANENYNMPTPTLPPGEAYFIQPAGDLTSTLAGTIAVSVGGTTNMNLPDSSGTTLYMVGSSVPYTGAITNAGVINLTNLPVGTTILVWNPTTTVQGAANTYTTFYYDPSYIGAPYFLGAWWDSANENFNMPVPILPVGGGIFIQPAGTYNWVQTLPGS